MIVLGGCEPTNAGPHRDTDAVAVFIRDLKSRMPQRIDACSDSVVHENIHAPCVLGRQVIGYVEVRNGSRDACRKGADIEIFKRSNAGLARTNVFPGSFNLVANRGNDSHAGNDDTSLTQKMIRVLVAELPSSMNELKKLVQRSSTAPACITNRFVGR